jgi:hypothetical protein
MNKLFIKIAIVIAMAGLVLAACKGGDKIIVLSGTITATYDGRRVPIVRIKAATTSGELLGSTQLASPDVGGPWSITIPAFDSPADVIFSVWGGNTNEDLLFFQGDAWTVFNVFNSNVTDIPIKPWLMHIPVSRTEPSR